jgi:hypothetical protein
MRINELKDIMELQDGRIGSCRVFDKTIGENITIVITIL